MKHQKTYHYQHGESFINFTFFQKTILLKNFELQIHVDPIIVHVQQSIAMHHVTPKRKYQLNFQVY